MIAFHSVHSPTAKGLARNLQPCYRESSGEQTAAGLACLGYLTHRQTGSNRKARKRNHTKPTNRNRGSPHPISQDMASQLPTYYVLILLRLRKIGKCPPAPGEKRIIQSSHSQLDKDEGGPLALGRK